MRLRLVIQLFCSTEFRQFGNSVGLLFNCFCNNLFVERCAISVLLCSLACDTVSSEYISEFIFTANSIVIRTNYLFLVHV